MYDPKNIFKPIGLRATLNLRTFENLPHYDGMIFDTFYKKDGLFRIENYFRLHQELKYKDVEHLPPSLNKIFTTQADGFVPNPSWVSFSKDNNSYFSWLTVGGLDNIGRTTWHAFSYPDSEMTKGVYNFLANCKN
jgi:hypothetical protein